MIAADVPAFSDFDRLWPVLAHPAAFPNAEGGPPEGMSLEFWMKVHLQRAPRELHGEQSMLVLDLFNIRQRHAVLRGAWVCMQSQPAVFQELASMPVEEIRMAMELFDTNRHAQTNAAFAEAPQRVKQLLRALRTVQNKVEGTPAWFASLRSRAFALWHAFGPFTVFPTYNPPELHNPWSLRALGLHAEYDWLQGFGMPTTMPTVVDRMKAVAKNPVACTQFFQTWRRAMWSVLHGWPMDSDAQINHNCLFGKIRAGMDRVENSRRLDLHLVLINL